MRESQLIYALIRGLYGVAHLDRVNCGTVTTQDGRKFSTGVPKGYSDLSGYLRQEVSTTGAPIPLYIEAKVGNNKPTEEQIRFIETKKKDGCIAGIVWSVNGAWDLLMPYIRKDTGYYSDDHAQQTEECNSDGKDGVFSGVFQLSEHP